MKVRVRLFGTLGQRMPGYQPSEGIEVEMPDEATVRELLALLGISESQGAVVIVEGRILKAGDSLPHGVPIDIVQAIRGG